MKLEGFIELILIGAFVITLVVLTKSCVERTQCYANTRSLECKK